MVSNIYLQLINYGDYSDVSFLLCAFLKINNGLLKVPKVSSIVWVEGCPRCFEIVMYPSISTSIEFNCTEFNRISNAEILC